MISETLYIAGHFIQILSYGLMAERVSRKGSVLGLSCDFVAYSYLWLTASCIYGASYLISSKLAAQYSKRYPLYTSYYTSPIVVLLDLVGSIVTFYLAWQTFKKFKGSRRHHEALSLPFYFFLSLLGCGLLVLIWYYLHGWATLNELDIANYFYVISYFGAIFRLIPQCSTNWYFLRFHVLHRHYLLMQTLSTFFLTTSLLHYKVNNQEWYELPTNILSSETLLVTWVCLAILLYQLQIYKGGKKILPQ